MPMTLANYYLAVLADADAAELEQLLRRFDLAWRRGDRPAIDDYLPPAPDPRRAALIELVLTDLEYRRGAGEPARVEDYLCRYPELAEDLAAARDLLTAAADPPQRESEAPNPKSETGEARPSVSDFGFGA